MGKLGIVVGMKFEAAIASTAAARHPAIERPILFVSGADPRRVPDGVKALVAGGAEALLSFGLAGGLNPALDTGAIVIADHVLLPDGARLDTDRTWRADLIEALAGGQAPCVGRILGADRPVLGSDEKRALHAATMADAVDMESHQVARVAREASLPFMALRVILDPAEVAVPRAALAGLTPDGATRLLPLLGALALRPWELPALLLLGRASARASKVLGRLATDLAPDFVFGA